MIRKSGWFVFFSLLAVSCLDEPECFSLNNDVVGISFKKLSDRTADTLYVSYVISPGRNVLFTGNENDSTITSLNLPLNYFANETPFQLEGFYANQTSYSLADTMQQFDLLLKYLARTQYVSEDCGERFVLTNLTAISAAFDSIRIVSAEPKRRGTNGTNIEIYRCPNISRVKFRFKEKVLLTAVSSEYFGSIALGPDSLTRLTLPLDTTATTTTSTFTFAFGDGSTKDLTVGYTNVKRKLFNACGARAFLSDLTGKSENIDSIGVVVKTIQDPPVTNFEIKF